jgi:3-oxoacyl-[acyl-carrier-protein] synthase II
VEDLEHAQRRGARIYGEIVGFGAAFDQRRDGAGIARAVKAAMAEAGIGPDEVDHINAHGLSARHPDIWEARGLYQVFGRCSPAVPVFAAKSYLGNLGAAGGPTELALSLLGMQHGQMPPQLNYDKPDPECPVTVLAGSPRPVRRPYVVKVSFNLLGQCGAIVIRKY